MAPEAARAIEHNIFTPGNYFYNGVGHVTVQYDKVLEIGLEGIIREAAAELAGCSVGDGDYARRHCFLEAVIMSCAAVIGYAGRYAALAAKEAQECTDTERKQELLQIASNCERVPAKGARSFQEACRASGSSSSFYRWNPADTPFLRDALTSTCILIIKGFGRRQDYQGIRLRNWLTASG